MSDRTARALDRLGSSETLLGSRCHVHVRVLSRDSERRAQRTNRPEHLRMLQAEQHGAPSAHRDAGDSAPFARGDRSISAVHALDEVVHDKILVLRLRVGSAVHVPAVARLAAYVAGSRIVATWSPASDALATVTTTAGAASP